MAMARVVMLAGGAVVLGRIIALARSGSKTKAAVGDITMEPLNPASRLGIEVRQLDHSSGHLKGKARLQAILRWIGLLDKMTTSIACPCLGMTRAESGDDVNNPVEPTQGRPMVGQAADADNPDENNAPKFDDVYYASKAERNVVISMIRHPPSQPEQEALEALLSITNARKLLPVDARALVDSVVRAAHAWPAVTREWKDRGECGSWLHLAAELGEAELARFLCLHGHPLDARNRAGETPLHVASREGHRATANAFLLHEQLRAWQQQQLASATSSNASAVVADIIAGPGGTVAAEAGSPLLSALREMGAACRDGIQHRGPQGGAELRQEDGAQGQLVPAPTAPEGRRGEPGEGMKGAENHSQGRGGEGAEGGAGDIGQKKPQGGAHGQMTFDSGLLLERDTAGRSPIDVARDAPMAAFLAEWQPWAHQLPPPALLSVATVACLRAPSCGDLAEALRCHMAAVGAFRLPDSYKAARRLQREYRHVLEQISLAVSSMSAPPPNNASPTTAADTASPAHSPTATAATRVSMAVSPLAPGCDSLQSGCEEFTTFFDANSRQMDASSMGPPAQEHEGEGKFEGSSIRPRGFVKSPAAQGADSQGSNQSGGDSDGAYLTLASLSSIPGASSPTSDDITAHGKAADCGDMVTVPSSGVAQPWVHILDGLTSEEPSRDDGDGASTAIKGGVSQTLVTEAAVSETSPPPPSCARGGPGGGQPPIAKPTTQPPNHPLVSGESLAGGQVAHARSSPPLASPGHLVDGQAATASGPTDIRHLCARRDALLDQLASCLATLKEDLAGLAATVDTAPLVAQIRLTLADDASVVTGHSSPSSGVIARQNIEGAAMPQILPGSLHALSREAVQVAAPLVASLKSKLLALLARAEKEERQHKLGCVAQQRQHSHGAGRAGRWEGVACTAQHGSWGGMNGAGCHGHGDGSVRDPRSTERQGRGNGSAGVGRHGTERQGTGTAAAVATASRHEASIRGPPVPSAEEKGASASGGAEEPVAASGDVTRGADGDPKALARGDNDVSAGSLYRTAAAILGASSHGDVSSDGISGGYGNRNQTSAADSSREDVSTGHCSLGGGEGVSVSVSAASEHKNPRRSFARAVRSRGKTGRAFECPIQAGPVSARTAPSTLPSPLPSTGPSTAPSTSANSTAMVTARLPGGHSSYPLPPLGDDERSPGRQDITGSSTHTAASGCTAAAKGDELLADPEGVGGLAERAAGPAPAAAIMLASEGLAERVAPNTRAPLATAHHSPMATEGDEHPPPNDGATCVRASSSSRVHPHAALAGLRTDIHRRHVELTCAVARARELEGGLLAHAHAWLANVERAGLTRRVAELQAGAAQKFFFVVGTSTFFRRPFG
eukprot:jgi/Mesvir1/2625/Mv16240-RA.1